MNEFLSVMGSYDWMGLTGTQGQIALAKYRD